MIRTFLRLMLSSPTVENPVDQTPRTTPHTTPAINDAVTALLDVLAVELHSSTPSTVTVEVRVSTWPWNSQHEGSVCVHEEGQPMRRVHVIVPA